MFEIDEKRTAYLDAENLSVDMPSKNHASVWSNIVMSFQKYKTKYRIFSQLSVVLNGKETIPDLCIYPNEEINWEHDEIAVTQAPVTVIEILSPKQGMQDLLDKFDFYFQTGVLSCWLILPALQQVIVYQKDRTKNNFLSGNIFDEVTGIEMDMKDVFA
jgi:Uma2 family endonuclease